MHRLLLKSIIIDSICLAVITLCMIPFWVNHMPDIPQGLLLGGLYGLLSLLVMYLITIKEEAKQHLVGAIIVIIVRLLVLGLILFLVGYLYYEKNVKAFNVFTAAGGYLISTVTLIVCSLIFKEKGE